MSEENEERRYQIYLYIMAIMKSIKISAKHRSKICMQPAEEIIGIINQWKRNSGVMKKAYLKTQKRRKRRGEMAAKMAAAKTAKIGVTKRNRNLHLNSGLNLRIFEEEIESIEWHRK